MRTVLLTPIVLIAGLIACSVSARAQGQPTASQVVASENKAMDVLRANDNDANFRKFDLRDRSIKGTPFINRRWVRMDVQLTGNQKLTAVPAKYDAYRRELRIQRPKGDSLIIEPRMVQQFVMHDLTTTGATDDRLFQRFPQLNDPKLAVEYFEVLYDKNGTQLLKLNRKSLQKGNSDSAYGGAMQNDRYEDKTEYYARLNEAATLQPLKMTAKSVSSIGPEWQKAVTNYGKPIRSEEELRVFLRQLP